MNTNQLINYMENLRYERRLTQEEYLQGIVSVRQYFRYRNNESEAPFEIIILLANRLEIPIFRLIGQYLEENERESKLVQEYFNSVIEQNCEKANQAYEQLKNVTIIGENNQRFYVLGNYLSEYNRGRLSKIELVSRIKDTIRYNEILIRSSIYDIELYMLGLVMQYSEPDRNRIINYIMSMNKNQKLMTGGNSLFISQVYFWLLKNLGRAKRYEEVIEIATNAIKFNQTHFSYYSLEYFYYYRALAFKTLGSDTLFMEDLMKTIQSLQFIDEDRKQKFYDKIRNDTSIDPIGLINNSHKSNH